MKILKTFAALLASITMLAALPGIANATGYIRIGDKCYYNTGGAYGTLIPFPCPDEVSENP